MKQTLILIAFFIAGWQQYACSQPVTAGSVPKELLYHAGAVIRNAELIEEVKGDAKTEITERYTITILNKSGEDAAEIVIGYDKTNKIKSVKGEIYNEFGIPVEKILEKNFRDVSAVSGGTLFADDRVKYFAPAINAYPYTIQYEVVIQSAQSLYFPVWYPANLPGIAVEKSSYTLITPPGFKIRYKERNFSNKMQESSDEKGNKKYEWTVTNQKAAKAEPYSPDRSEFATSVTVVPESFTYFGSPGEFTDWNSLGKWMNSKLLADRSKLPDETKQKILTLTKGTADPKEKAKLIYEYVQQKTRYISVQIGIGGFRPMLATEVDELGYGDCKALSFYTKCLMDVAGIPSYYCVVYGGRNQRKNPTNDFATMFFGNHIILCLPFPGDTTWLECTSQTNSFGYLGSFTDDRTVLACTPDGGRLMHTTCYKPEVNKQLRQADFVIDTLGNLSGSVKTTYEGLQFDNVEYCANLPYVEQVKTVTKTCHIENLTIQSLSYKKTKGKIPVMEEDMKLAAYDFGSVSGKRMYLYPNVLNRKTETPKEVSNRQNPVTIYRGCTDTDEISLTLPAGYKVEYMPENRTEESEFGKYTLTLKQDGNKLTVKRTTYYKEGTFPPEEYSKLVDFYGKIFDTDNKKLVLVKE